MTNTEYIQALIDNRDKIDVLNQQIIDQQAKQITVMETVIATQESIINKLLKPIK